jgi:hypothetical protein
METPKRVGVITITPRGNNSLSIFLGKEMSPEKKEQCHIISKCEANSIFKLVEKKTLYRYAEMEERYYENSEVVNLEFTEGNVKLKFHRSGFWFFTIWRRGKIALTMTVKEGYFDRLYWLTEGVFSSSGKQKILEKMSERAAVSVPVA